MKHKKLLVIVIVFILFCVSLFGYFFFYKKDNGGVTAKVISSSQNAEKKNYLLEGYPLETVPLFKMKMVSASKFFVNKDPSRYADYFGKRVNYYNVVLETEVTPNEYLSYYRSLMNEINEDSVSESQIEGKIGKYKVAASHYGDSPKNYGYLQVYLPEEEYQEINRYYQDYPNVVELDASWPEHESSYGLLNQKGGEIEYTQYFPLPKEEVDQDTLIGIYKEKYQNESSYVFNKETGLMSWNKDGYSINMSWSKDHGRIYLMIRHRISEN